MECFISILQIHKYTFLFQAQNLKDGVDSVGVKIADATANDDETKCNLCKEVAADIFLCTVCLFRICIIIHQQKFVVNLGRALAGSYVKGAC